MADTINYNINLTGGDGGEEPTETTPQQEGEINADNPSTARGQNKSARKAGVVGAVGLSVAKKSVGYATSNIGKWTGSSNAQDLANDAIKLAGYAVLVGTAPVAGIAFIAFEGIINTIDRAYEMRMDRIRIDVNKRRSGNFQTNKSR